MDSKKLIEAFKEWLKKNEPVIDAQIDQDGAVMACVSQKAFIAGAMHGDGKEQWPEDVAGDLDPTAIQGGVVSRDKCEIKPDAWLMYPAKKPELKKVSLTGSMSVVEKNSGWVKEPLFKSNCSPELMKEQLKHFMTMSTHHRDCRLSALEKLAQVEVERNELQARLGALKSAIHQTQTIGRHCLSEDDCINSGVDFPAYERGVLDAVNAMQSHLMAAINKSKGGGK